MVDMQHLTNAFNLQSWVDQHSRGWFARAIDNLNWSGSYISSPFLRDKLFSLFCRYWMSIFLDRSQGGREEMFVTGPLEPLRKPEMRIYIPQFPQYCLDFSPNERNFGRNVQRKICFLQERNVSMDFKLTLWGCTIQCCHSCIVSWHAEGPSLATAFSNRCQIGFVRLGALIFSSKAPLKHEIETKDCSGCLACHAGMTSSRQKRWSQPDRWSNL